MFQICQCINCVQHVLLSGKQCIFLYNTMGTTGVRQGMGIMHLDVMDTVFHSGDSWDSMP